MPDSRHAGPLVCVLPLVRIPGVPRRARNRVFAARGGRFTPALAAPPPLARRWLAPFLSRAARRRAATPPPSFPIRGRRQVRASAVPWSATGCRPGATFASRPPWRQSVDGRSLPESTIACRRTPQLLRASRDTVGDTHFWSQRVRGVFIAGDSRSPPSSEESVRSGRPASESRARGNSRRRSARSPGRRTRGSVR